MWPDRVSNPGPPTYESGALPIALRGPATHADSSCAKPAMTEGVSVLRIYYNETGHTFALVTLATEHRKSLPQCLCMI